MGEGLAVLFEVFLATIISKFEFIGHPIVRSVVQIVAMIVVCALFIACVVLIAYFIKWLKSC